MLVLVGGVLGDPLSWVAGPVIGKNSITLHLH